MRFHGILLLALAAAVIAGANAGAQSVGELLEKGIYTEETVGDLDAAIAIYRRVVETAEAERRHAARALYRMGCCYRKAGKNRQAEEAFRRLVQTYGDQTALATKARGHLPALEKRALALGPAPWVDGERLHYSVTLENGRHLGDLTYTAFTKKDGDREVWRLESSLGCPLYGIVKFMNVEAEKESFLPIRAYLYHTNIGQARAEYGPEVRKMMLNRPGGKPKHVEQKLAARYFDNEQNVYVVRRLPLAVGYKVVIPFTGRPGVTYTATLGVEGREEVEVPAGRFTCFRVDVAAAGRFETYWIADHPRRYVVKTKSVDSRLELTHVGRRVTAGATRRLASAGLTVRVPAGWDLVESGDIPARHGFAQLFAPEMEAWGMFYRVPAKGQTARARAEKQIAGMKKKVKGYTLRAPGIVDDRTYGGIPAVTFTSDLVLRGWSMTERQTCFRVGESLYIVVFVTLRDNFARHEAAIERALSGLVFTGS